MTIEQLNTRLAARTIVLIEKYGEVYRTDLLKFGEAKADPANEKWCYVRQDFEGAKHLYPIRKSLLEEIVERGIAIMNRSNEAEIEAQRKAGVYPLPEYVTRTTHYVLT